MCVRESEGVLMCFSERLQYNYSEISGSVFWLIKPESLQDMNETRRGKRGAREHTEERHAAHFYNPEQYIYAVLTSGFKKIYKEGILTCRLNPPPDNQIHLAGTRCPVHQVNDISVWLPHHWDSINKEQLIAGPQAPI